MVSFPGRVFVSADIPAPWVTADDLSAPLNPPFLSELEARTGSPVNNVDLVLLATPVAGPPPLDLLPLATADHPRVLRAHRYRRDVRVWTAPA